MMYSVRGFNSTPVQVFLFTLNNFPITLFKTLRNIALGHRSSYQCILATGLILLCVDIVWLSTYDALPYFVDDLFSGVILCKFLMFRRLDASVGERGYNTNMYTLLLPTSV